MINEMALQAVAASINGEVVFGDCRFTRVCTDSRQLQAGDLFVALRGPRFDAHQFLQQAADQGACGLVVEKADSSVNLPQLVVEDTTLALGQLAKLNRNLFKGSLVAITGSGGKTTVKTLLRNIFAQCGNVYATKGNLNNHIGVPLSLFELSAEHDYAVIEMGASGPGEIAYLVDLAAPDVGLVNNALRAHVEGFGSLEGVAWAKGEMFAGLREDGTAVVNLDDPQVEIWLGQAGSRRRITFSVADKAADLVAKEIIELDDGRVQFVLVTPNGECKVTLQLIGRHNVANALAAAACAHAVGIEPAAIKSGLEASEAVAGRMQRKAGIKGSTVIDDSYNANPDSAKAAVDSLVRWPGRTVLVLGQMAELGRDAEKFHQDLGLYAKTVGIDLLVAVGGLTRQCSDSFGSGAHYFEDCDQAAEFLRGLVDGNTVALIKGSRSAHMERVVKALTEGGER
ncbi:UDP-N-acetylmuramoyl-tripeptide--D-alanyl-D-alanine ligase [Proteobacteria bacterium 005FR1]|nr:UDP-N-acetylmuramoyl-tripeptide--D-alanyl-D-alanine ligase [Proteobacteria bacterium 005FR1]